MELKPEDLEVSMYPDTPRTGMQAGTVNGIKLTHKPTGIVIIADTERSQHKNRNKALEQLRERLKDIK